MQLIGEFWTDDNNNKWPAKGYTLEKAEIASKSLYRCTNCIDCHNCRGCTNCIDCIDCIDCHNCRGCIDCSGCYYCSDCQLFHTNPMRVVSPKIGSRHNQTTIYWDTEGRTQVVCGCYENTLENFEKRILNVHGDNIYGIQYMNFIRKVKIFMGMMKDLTK